MTGHLHAHVHSMRAVAGTLRTLRTLCCRARSSLAVTAVGIRAVRQHLAATVRKHVRL